MRTLLTDSTFESVQAPGKTVQGAKHIIGKQMFLKRDGQNDVIVGTEKLPSSLVVFQVGVVFEEQ